MWRSISILLFLLILTTEASAGTRDIWLGYRPGGLVKWHMDIADRWLREGKRLHITDDQWSAAARQVEYYARQGGKVCAMPGVRLYYHWGYGWKVKTPKSVGIGRC